MVKDWGDFVSASRRWMLLARQLIHHYTNSLAEGDMISIYQTKRNFSDDIEPKLLL